MNIDLPATLTADLDVRPLDETDSGLSFSDYVILKFGDTEVAAWAVPEDENRAWVDKRKFVEQFVAAKLGALLK